MAVPPKPAQYHSITPYLMVRGASEAIAFYKEAFGAVEVFRIPRPGGLIGHAEIKLGDSTVMLADEHPGMVHGGPQTAGGTTVGLYMYDANVDACVAAAEAAGAAVVRHVEDQDYGDRNATVQDPFGHLWTIATKVTGTAHHGDYHTVTPYLFVRNAAAAIAFYHDAFGTAEAFRVPSADGKLTHAELKVGDSKIMLADEAIAHAFGVATVGPQTLADTTISLLLYDPDVDARCAHAAACGAKIIRPVADQFYGDRTGTLCDPFGHVWTIATHQEDVSHAEMLRLIEKMAAEHAGG